ncbi:histidine kinase [Chitinophaga sp. 212800010-3]|uniref:sensor histidine kinase n=1 Tax=unclassified Chitinophaga TaxID=2619133 RepID=UPI002DEC0251|nr:hypothetical protein [Chitinophaga sp. 212800010-3]
MTIKWRKYELLLITVIFAGFCLICAWRYFNPQGQQEDWDTIRLFKDHGLQYNPFLNHMVPDMGIALLCFLVYLGLTLAIVPLLWPQGNRPHNHAKKILSLGTVFMLLIAVFTAAFITSVYLKEEWRYHYSGFTVFYNVHNGHDNIDLNCIWPIAFLVAGVLAYISLREELISFLERPGPNRNYRVMITNQATIFLGAYLLFLMLLQYLLKIPWSDLFTRLYLLPVPAIAMGLLAMYYLFPAYTERSWLHRGLSQRLILWSAALSVPVPLLMPGSPVIVFFFAWAFQLMIVIPVSWLLYQQQKDHILAFRGLEKDLSQSRANLGFLRSQINPHFLFNTLNTIYASAIEEQAARTARCLQQLGDMMRFMLEENHADRIPVEKEINYLKNYIALQQLRLPVSEKISIDVAIDTDEQAEEIVPMLLIPLIENAFKHGVSLQENTAIRIRLRLIKGRLQLDIQNTIHAKVTEGESDSPGTGLANVRERLKLIYPGRHWFKAGPSEDLYISQLIIQL